MSLDSFMGDLPKGAAAEMAKALKISPIYLQQIRVRQKGPNGKEREASTDLCVRIEKYTGKKVMRWHLRPYDWHEHWPELMEWDGAPEVPDPEPAKAEG